MGKVAATPHETFAIDLPVEAGKRLRLIVQSESPQPVGDLVSWRQLAIRQMKLVSRAVWHAASNSIQ